MQSLIVEAIQTYNAVPTSLDEHGQRYVIDFPVTRNQNTVSVRTTWIIRSTENFPRLTSCYILR
ncbi:DUF6883 domain-containing protein [Leptolyngbya sp. FACHB-671]|uniref:DUF6883 domain-containing protein n=1 Tax=Leptolyngbya sp. FACHB-671 TaxID=2692812 RepID=UPI00322090CC